MTARAPRMPNLKEAQNAGRDEYDGLGSRSFRKTGWVERNWSSDALH